MAVLDGLAALLAAVARGEIARGRDAARRITLATVCFVLAGIAFLAASGFGVAVLWLLVLPHVGPLGAALICAGALITLALLLCALGSVVLRRRRARPRTGAEGIAPLVEAALQLTNDKGVLLLIALVAGLVAGSGKRGKDR